MEQRTYDIVLNEYVNLMKTNYAPHVEEEPFNMTEADYLRIVEQYRTEYKEQRRNHIQRPFCILEFNIKNVQIDFSFGLNDFFRIKDVEPGKPSLEAFNKITKCYHPLYGDAISHQSYSIYMATLKYGSEVLKNPRAFSAGFVIPLECYNRQYHWFEIRTQILKYDRHGHIISHIVRYEQIKPYIDGISNILEINFYIDGFLGLLFHKMAAKSMREKLADFFSPTEWNLIKDYAGVEDGAKEQHTKDYLNKLRFKIVHKATSFFGYKFQRVELLATYLKEKDMLD
ncbi:MAG: hypothetical protein JNL70_01620 [Saprospiraceae bacterium]|nr:hypothetical protein [Saprospiraceae bacterium]